MAYRVEFTERATRDLEALYLEKEAAEGQAASRWFDGLEVAVGALRDFPHRCPAAPEGRKMRRQLRHLLYGKKPHVYRVIYEVEDGQKTVLVLHIRHGARRKLKWADLG